MLAAHDDEQRWENIKYHFMKLREVVVNWIPGTHDDARGVAVGSKRNKKNNPAEFKIVEIDGKQVGRQIIPFIEGLPMDELNDRYDLARKLLDKISNDVINKNMSVDLLWNYSLFCEAVAPLEMASRQVVRLGSTFAGRRGGEEKKKIADEKKIWIAKQLVDCDLGRGRRHIAYKRLCDRIISMKRHHQGTAKRYGETWFDSFLSDSEDGSRILKPIYSSKFSRADIDRYAAMPLPDGLPPIK